jgi:adenine-specific DNA-methyltransferase
MTQAPDIQALKGQSMNLTEHNIEQLKQLFPNVFAEGKIDFEALKSELGEFTETDNERYQFTWNGKEQAKRIATTPTLGTLRPAPEESVNWDTTENMYIEGDNLEVLKLLQKSYFGKIKMIYIDPPYNTGKDFVYKDDFKDNLANYQRLTGQKDEEGNPLTTNTDSSGRYHSNWLNMMYPRLKLARNLLKDDGVIFISIDDNEIQNLRKACDEVFGEANFLGSFVVNSSPSAIDYGHLGNMHDYIVMYAKNFAFTETFQIPEKDKKFKYEDQVGPYNIYPLYNGNVAFNPQTRPNLHYPFYLNPNNKIDNDFYEISLNPHNDWEKVYPVVSQKDGISRVWRWGKTKASGELNKEIIGYKTTDGEYRVVQKTRHTGKVIRSLLMEKSYSSRRGTAEVQELFGKKVFDFPKATQLLKTLVCAGSKETDIVLDFFSGSATSAHSVMQLNSEDSGNRKFILVQIPESTPEKSEAKKAGYETIAEIGKERIRRAAKKIKEEHPDTQADLGFKVFKLDTSNIKKWQPNIDDLDNDLLSAVDNILPDRTSQDLLFEVLIKYGLPLTLPVEQINIQNNSQTYQAWNVANNALIACFDENLTLEAVQAIAALSTPENPVLRVVFRDTSFQNDITKTNAIQRLKQAGIEDVLSI